MFMLCTGRLLLSDTASTMPRMAINGKNCHCLTWQRSCLVYRTLMCLWCDQECAIEHMIILMGQTSCECGCTFSLAFISPGILTGRKGTSSARRLPWQSRPYLQNPSDVLQYVERALRIQVDMYGDRPHLWVRCHAASTVPWIVKVREGPIEAINDRLSASPPPNQPPVEPAPSYGFIVINGAG